MTAPIAALVRRLTCEKQTATDSELLTHYATSRDQAAFELLVWRHAGAVWATCRRMLHPDRAAAEDACQAAFLALALHANRLRQSGAVAGWLRKVAVRACLDLQGRRRPAQLPAEPPSTSREPVQTASDSEVRAALDDGLNRLPDKFRLPFVLCEVDGMSNAEAAAVLGCAVGTVESRLTRARQRLRTFLTGRGVQPAVVAGTLAIPDAVRASLFNVHPESGRAGLRDGVRELAAQAVGGGLVSKLRAAVAVGVLLVASAVGFGVMPGDTPARASKPPETAPPPRLAEVRAVIEPKVPVPDGVVRRLGSPRLRHPAWVTAIAFSQDGKRIATVGYDNTIHIWDAETGQGLFAIPCAKGEKVNLGFIERGKTLTVSGELQEGDKKQGHQWYIDATTGEIRERVPGPANWPMAGRWYSPDGTKVLVTGRAGAGIVCTLVDTATQKQNVDLWNAIGRVPATFGALTPRGDKLVLGTRAYLSVVSDTAKTQKDCLELYPRYRDDDLPQGKWTRS